MNAHTPSPSTLVFLIATTRTHKYTNTQVVLLYIEPRVCLTREAPTHTNIHIFILTHPIIHIACIQRRAEPPITRISPSSLAVVVVATVAASSQSNSIAYSV